MNRISYDMQTIVTEIEGGIGSDLSFSSIYDEIKSARTHEDERLSLGVWERELKKADWPLVESLCVDVISSKSKDLQCIAWLIEATCAMDGLAGVSKSFDILAIFLETFWYSCFPNDDEQKIQLLNLVVNNINSKLLVLNFAEDICLYDYEYALTINTNIKRYPLNESEILESARKSGRKTIDEIQSIIKKCQLDHVRNAIKDVENSLSLLAETVKKISSDTTIVSFTSIVDNTRKIKNIIEVREQAKVEVLEPIKSTDGDIYDQIKLLASDFKKTEKHSPVPYVLDLVVSWKDKSLFEIMSDLQTGDTEAHKLLKFLTKN